MPDISDFNTGAGVKAERKLLVTYLNTGTTAVPVWSPIGYGVEDSAIEFNFDDETVTDILGITETSLSKPQRKQTFEPCEIRGGDPVQIKLYNIIRHEQWAQLSAMDMLLVHYYAGTSGSYDAERFKASAINPQSLGGSGNLELPFEVTFGGEHVLGTAARDADTGVVEFTAA